MLFYVVLMFAGIIMAVGGGRSGGGFGWAVFAIGMYLAIGCLNAFLGIFPFDFPLIP